MLDSDLTRHYDEEILRYHIENYINRFFEGRSTQVFVGDGRLQNSIPLRMIEYIGSEPARRYFVVVGAEGYFQVWIRGGEVIFHRSISKLPHMTRIRQWY